MPDIVAPSEAMKYLEEIVAELNEGSVDTLRNWIVTGSRIRGADGKFIKNELGQFVRIKLPAQLRFNRLMTSTAAVERHIAAIQPAYIAAGQGEEARAMELPAARKKRQAAAKAVLRAHGVKV